jgi:hypothetical protein
MSSGGVTRLPTGRLGGRGRRAFAGLAVAPGIEGGASLQTTT